MSASPRVGVLALQGNFALHAARLAELGAEVVEVRRPAQLSGLAGLVMPGGESTTLLKLMSFEPSWWEALPQFVAEGGALLGTCAGLILLAREVREPAQRSFGLLDIVVQRNGYGRQIDSFETTGEWTDGSGELEMVFIRAPRVLELGDNVEVLARHEGEPVMVRQGRVTCLSFHPELGADTAVHARFLASLGQQTAPAEAS